MLEEMTAEQYSDWLAYMRKYHPTTDRDDVHWGLLIAAVENQWAGEGERVRPIDRMPYHDRFEEELTREELLLRIGIIGD